MNKEMLGKAAIGLGLVGIAVAALLYFTRGSYIRLDVQIQKVRLQQLDENSTAIILDFRVTNPADYPFVVRKVDVILVEKDDKILEGTAIAEVDARRLFEYYPAMGPKYNSTLLMRERIARKETLDRMVATRVDMPQSRVEQRKTLRLRIEEVDGAVTEVEEKR